MKKLAISVIGLSILSFGIYSCTKENSISKDTNSKILKSTLNDLPPSEIGEFYNYSVNVSSDNPLLYMRKCKANKSEPTLFAVDFINELDLVFVFDNGVKLCSPNSVSASILTNNNPNVNQTEIRTTDISLEDFNSISSQMDKDLVESTFNNGTATNTELIQGNMIYAVKTAQNEYGLILIKSISNTSVSFDACHFRK